MSGGRDDEPGGRRARAVVGRARSAAGRAGSALGRAESAVRRAARLVRSRAPGPAGRRWLAVGLAVAGTAAIAATPVSPALTTEGRYALATMYFAAVLWVTGALPLALTALLVPVVLTVLGVYPEMDPALAGFADPVIFLLLAGFALAAALQAHGVDRRVAYAIMARVGTSPRRLVLAVMVATALLSMLVSNTATTAMMVPVAVGLVGQVTGVAGGQRGTTGEDGATGDGAATGGDAVHGDDSDHVDSDGGTGAGGATGRPPDATADAADATDATDAADATNPASAATNVQVATMLGIAYAASLGGVGTLVGTPPNAIVVGQLRELLGVRLSFVDWLFVGMPMVVVTLPLAWFLLVYVVYPPEVADVTRARERAGEQLRASGPLDTAARRTVAVFAATVALWLLGGLGFLFVRVLPPAWHTTLFGGTGPTVLGTTGHQGLLYFVLVGLLAIPALVLSGAVDWTDLLDIDWGTLLLLGGGISLADALSATGATEWLAGAALGVVGDAPFAVVLLAALAMVVAVGELASNTAMAAIVAPLLISIGPSYAGTLGTTGEQAGVFLALAGAVAASYGFALPVATPPNAIAYGSGYVTRAHMLRAGLVLDAVVVLTATGIVYLLLQFVWPAVLV